eukprot:m.10765 g.10765  ORF g.10765 m.10765 type:complete len:652 (-) comp9677_c0_seq3:169-2124(-)
MNHLIGLTMAILVLSGLEPSLAQSSDAECGNSGTSSEINVVFDPDAYDRYTGPGKQVKRWHRADIPKRAEEEDDESFRTQFLSYVSEDILAKSLAPFIVVCALLTLSLLCFFFYRCCCKKCLIRRPSHMTELVLLILVLGLLFVAFVFVAVGLAADRDQSDFMTSIPEVADVFVETADRITEFTNDIIAIINLIRADLVTLGTNFGSHPSLLRSLDAIVTSLTLIQGTADAADFGEFQDGFIQTMEQADGSRSRAFRAILALLCLMIILTAVIALLNAKGPMKYRPKHYCGCRILTIVLQIGTFMLFVCLCILSCFLIVGARVMGDLCFEFDSTMINWASLTTSTELYYVTCDENATLRDCGNPFVEDINSISQRLRAVNSAWGDVSSSMCDGANAATCETIDDNINLMVSMTQELVAELLSCSALNRPYQSLAVLMCSDLAESVGSTANLLIAFVVIYFIAQILTRLLSDADDEVLEIAEMTSFDKADGPGKVVTSSHALNSSQAGIEAPNMNFKPMATVPEDRPPAYDPRRRVSITSVDDYVAPVRQRLVTPVLDYNGVPMDESVLDASDEMQLSRRRSTDGSLPPIPTDYEYAPAAGQRQPVQAPLQGIYGHVGQTPVLTPVQGVYGTQREALPGQALNRSSMSEFEV